MKKIVFKSLLLGIAALTALNASAENKLIMEDFEITPGEKKTVLLQIQHDQRYSAIQVFFEPVDGLTFGGSFCPDEAGSIDDDETWPVNGRGKKVAVEPEYNFDTKENCYKIVLHTGANGPDGFVQNWAPGLSMICEIELEAAADFTGGQIICRYCKGDYSDPEAPADWRGNFEIENQLVCNVTIPVAATSLADIVATGEDNVEYTVAEDLHIVAKSDKGGYLFVSDAQGNWMKVKAEGDVYTALAAMEDIKGGTLKGVLSEADCNQTLTVTEIPTEGTDVVPVTAVAWNLAMSDASDPQFKFAPKVNEVIKLTGYWFNSDNAFRGYATQKGQSASANFDWCDTDATMNNGVLYKDVVAVAQLKAPWDAEAASAPAKVAASDDLSFQNYTVYPLAIEENNVITGVENLNAGQNVVSVQYVNAAGMVSATPFQGVNMVVTRYADGSQVTTKVVK